MEEENSPEEYSFDSLEFALDKVDLEDDVASPSTPRKYPETQIYVKMEGQKINMKIDSGAEANVISNEVFEKIQQGTGRQTHTHTHSRFYVLVSSSRGLDSSCMSSSDRIPPFVFIMYRKVCIDPQVIHVLGNIVQPTFLLTAALEIPANVMLNNLLGPAPIDHALCVAEPTQAVISQKMPDV